MTRTILAASALALLAACTQQPTTPAPDDESAPAPSPSREARTATGAAASPDEQTPGRQHAYTPLENCPVIRQEFEEMPFVEVECPGAAGFDVRIADSDARQTMTLVDPGGTPHRLATSRIGGGGFSAFGKTAEWRGDSVSAAGGRFEPDSLIVRYEVAEQPHPAPETSYLLVVRLAGDPCIIARIAPGPQQNDSARATADNTGACLGG